MRGDDNQTGELFSYRLLEGDIAAKFMRAVLAQPRVNRLLSGDHLSVDGTLIETWASMKSIKLNGPDAFGQITIGQCAGRW